MPAKRRAHFTAHTRTNKRRLVQQISFQQRHARAWKSGRIYIFDIGVATEIANDLIRRFSDSLTQRFATEYNLGPIPPSGLVQDSPRFWHLLDCPLLTNLPNAKNGTLSANLAERPAIRIGRYEHEECGDSSEIGRG